MSDGAGVTRARDAGLGDTAALELLSVAGLINYFGRSTDLREVQVSPVLLQKGRTRLALYGLGNIRDERLHRIFTSDKVTAIFIHSHTHSATSACIASSPATR